MIDKPLKDAPDRTVAIVGGGVSGALVAAHLVTSDAVRRVLLIEPRTELGRGLAHSTPNPAHLLNVPAGGISALPEEPDHFLAWARNRMGSDLDPSSFLPRELFGTYVGSLLQERLDANGAASRFQHLPAQVQSLCLDQDGVTLHLDGETVRAGHAVLALGNAPARTITGADGSSPVGSSRYFAAPWDLGALTRPEGDEDVLLIGTGLTAVDAVMALRGTGYSGTIHAFSRHGHLPQAHRTLEMPAELPLPDPAPTTIRRLFSLLRKQMQQAAEQGLDWRVVIDALRPHTNDLWTALPAEDRRRFYRHVRTLWDMHRHRMPPAVAETLSGLRAEGILSVRAARLAAVETTPGGFRVDLTPRGTGSMVSLEVGRIINCTGPETDYRRITSPLVVDLLAQGLLVPGPLGQGLRVTPEGALYQADGKPSERLFTLGPPRIGTLLETIAVPEIRVQAAQLAHQLVRRCHEPRSS